jgi:hypothetical protein
VEWGLTKGMHPTRGLVGVSVLWLGFGTEDK